VEIINIEVLYDEDGLEKESIEYIRILVVGVTARTDNPP
jgi:hypothetical protein